MTAILKIDGIEVMSVETTADTLSVTFPGGHGRIVGEGHGKRPIVSMLSAGQFGECLRDGEVWCSRAEYDELRQLAFVGDTAAQSLLSRVAVVDL
jgi:hypothetical protein